MALDKEYEAINEKHLLLAKNLTGTLDRYVQDVELAFRMTTKNLPTMTQINGLDEMLVGLDFRHVCVIDANGLIQRLLCALACPKSDRFPVEVLKKLGIARIEAEKNPGNVIFSDLILNPKGAPTIYLLQSLGDGLLAIGELSPEFIRAIQKAISFGKLGHAAIVDRSGRLIAHPLPDWVSTMKDISKLSIVKKMMNGESGVIKFFSPALKADMIAGYNVVPRTGWGVMIPQPFSELEERAASLRSVVLAITAIGASLAIFLSWWLSGLLSLPMRKVADAANRFAGGGETLELKTTSWIDPTEISDLTRSFNYMVKEKGKRSAELAAAVSEATSATQAKSEFLASMSHELRTPLTSSLGSLGLLKNISYDDLSSESKDLVDIALRNNQALLRLVNELLDYEKIQSGTLSIKTSRHNICDLTS
ncbi:MAG: Cache 3/Cache 2 fusion domain-containing protein, partial [Rhodobacter sp.]|nr:Cache 3/Cache 2 fusion domain-containing protein [Rhodobacter sp.]